MTEDSVHPRGIITNAIGDTLDELPIQQVLRSQTAVWEALGAAGYAVVSKAELTELREYFESGADADMPSGQQYLPNDEMRMLVIIDAMIDEGSSNSG